MTDQSQVSAAAMFNSAAVIDELGFIKAQIAELEAKEKTLTDALKATGADKFSGSFFDATVSRSERENIDVRRLKEDLGEDVIKDYRKAATQIVTLKLTAKK